jgi:BASS family bile acid:Na+ symporter
MMDRLINILVLVTLIEMMLAVGLSVTSAELLSVARSRRLVLRALLANYVCVPALTVVLLLMLGTTPIVAAGFLILALCPGAPFGPPCTAIARGNTTVAVGMMGILAASSALVAPLLLSALLAVMPAADSADAGTGMPEVDAATMVRTLLLTQLVPLAVGLGVRHYWPAVAARLHRPANALSVILGLAVIPLILIVQFDTLNAIRPRGFAGMLLLLIGSLAAGWLLGGPGVGTRRAMALTTSLRNVGVGLVIATSAFPNSAAATAVIAYGIIEILGSLLVAVTWGRLAQSRDSTVARKHQPDAWRQETRQLS